jgi:hypothetical protein
VLGAGDDDQLREAVLAEYKAMSRRTRSGVLIVEYSCRPKGCLLLHVWNTPCGRFYYQPRYRLSREATQAETSESARGKRTSDGDHKWLPRAGSFDALLNFCGDEPDLGLDLNCDHGRLKVIGRRLAADIRGKTPGKPGSSFRLPDDDTPKGLGGAYDCPPV